MPDNADILVKARAAYEDMQDKALAASVLADMPSWVATGNPPPAATLRASGLVADPTDPDAAAALRLVRRAFIRAWGYAVPCAEAVVALRGLRPLVEVGAGTGCWTAMLRSAGHDMIATDLQAEGVLNYGFKIGAHCAIEALGGEEAVRQYAERDVFCSWPTEGSTWVLSAAQAIQPGRKLALIADGPGGVTGTPELFEFLTVGFEVTDRVTLPQFQNAHDHLTVYRRV
jgi:hypothetical protein